VFVSAIIPAAGKGRRFDSKLNKQFWHVQNRPILAHTVQQFEAATLVDEIILVVPEEWIASVKSEVVERFGFQKVRAVIAGGRERYESVWNGIEAVHPDTSIIAIHDGVRPQILPARINAAIERCQEVGAVTLAVPLKDSVKKVVREQVVASLDRSLLWAIQTPQVFEAQLIRQAHQQIQTIAEPVTDDAQLVEALGVPVYVVEGDYRNIKITTKDDLEWFELYLQKVQREK
jgi:2-C-methyl-D-erythritol 4-phosphate cytidylyltransferase